MIFYGFKTLENEKNKNEIKLLTNFINVEIEILQLEGYIREKTLNNNNNNRKTDKALLNLCHWLFFSNSSIVFVPHFRYF